MTLVDDTVAPAHVPWSLPGDVWRQEPEGPRTARWRRVRPTGRWTPHTDPGEQVAVTVGSGHCVGCTACVDVCRPGVLRLMDGVRSVSADPDACNGCRRCEAACPFGLVRVAGPTRNRHRVVLESLGAALAAACPAGWEVRTAPPPGRLLGPAMIVPDLAVVARQHGPWTGPPAVGLVVEVVAPATRVADLGRRRDVYRAYDVPAYWTVDQRDGAVTVHWSGGGWVDRLAHRSYG